MRGPFKILVAVMLVLSGLHIAEPAHAGEDGLRHQLEHSSHMPEDPDQEGQPGHVTHAGHHHCPIAPDQVDPPTPETITPIAALPCSRPVAALHSLTRAPPLQPPSA